MIEIRNLETGKATICCKSTAADLLGVERNDLRRMLRVGQKVYRHFEINENVEIIPMKKRGKLCNHFTS